ncbi:FAD:protein FMN transferase [Microbispora corallina]|uniref:FAD:protein FMN transferase n=1 Tax=Microbispora corallina TaxID=83302 RepID=A0ABQ4FUK5_9ACTN|nr:FAD:protein FMN transferase [Microbispora corallina]GIH38447.1 FAD:protein FMN transferase [Microbispora corallina]
MRHVEHVMGTVFSFDVRGREPGDPVVVGAVTEAVSWLHWVDETFSTYRLDSPVSRLGRGEIALPECPPEVSEVLRLCEEMSVLSNGYFTAHPGGRLDPSGMVKGWAIEQASRILSCAGLVNHCVNGGGDIQAVGSPAPGRPWRVGIAHPLRPGMLATVVTGPGDASGAGSAGGAGGAANATAGSDPDVRAAGDRAAGPRAAEAELAVATSGTAERGAHILDPHTGRPPTALASLTVVGASLTIADACATAAFAMGDRARDWVEELDGLEAFAVTASGQTWRTSGFPADSPTRRA